MKELKIEVYGRVQGISFRYSVKRFAEKNGIKGYIMNREDGSVEIVVQGSTESVEKLLSWVRSNPGLSRVEKVKVSILEKKQRFVGFDIVRNGNFVVDKSKSGVHLSRRLFN